MTSFVRAKVDPAAKTLPARWYLSPEVFASERERLFARGWVCVGRVEQIERPGDFFLATVAQESVIVTRDAANLPRAFYNVCRHRGTRMCEAASGHFNGSIQCPYHAWTYGLDGTLKVARNMTDVVGFDRNEYPLNPVALAQWEGFVFLNLSNDADPFERGYEALSGRFSRWAIGGLRTARAIGYELDCNWKLVFQNYSECYHCPLVHPQLDKLSPSDSGRNDLCEGPVLGGFSELRKHGGSLTTSGMTARPALGSVSGEDLDRIYYYTLFPSMLLSLHPDYVMVHYVTPLAPNRTAIVCAWLFDPQVMASEDFDPTDAVEFWDLTNRQDWHVSELSQCGISSRAYRPGPYANAEGLLGAFDRHYLAAMTE